MTKNEDGTTIFVYGIQVDDFMNLKKDYLYALHFSATQQLDRLLTQTMKQVDEQVIVNENLQKELDKHKTKFDNQVIINQNVQAKLDEQTTINENLQKQIDELKKLLIH